MCASRYRCEAAIDERSPRRGLRLGRRSTPKAGDDATAGTQRSKLNMSRMCRRNSAFHSSLRHREGCMQWYSEAIIGQRDRLITLPGNGLAIGEDHLVSHSLTTCGGSNTLAVSF